MSKPTLLGPVSTLPPYRPETMYEDYTKTGGIPNELALSRAWNFSRAGSATYWGPDGKLHVAGPDEPRFHYDPLTGEPLGLLVEDEATNLWHRLADFSNLTRIRATLVPGFAAPDGSLTATFLREDTSTNLDHYLYASGALVGDDFFVFAKANGNRYFQVARLTPTRRVVFDLIEGVIVRNDDGIGYIKPLSDGWHLCGWSRPYENNLSQIALITQKFEDYVSYTGDGVSGTIIWGAQLTLGIGRVSYIPTNGSAVTRPADILTRDLTAPAYNPNQGTLILRANNRTGDTIYLDGVTTNPLKLSQGEGTLVYTYDQDGGKVYAPNTEYGDDGPPAEPTLTPAKEGYTDLRLLAYYPRKFSEDEARLNAHGTFSTREWDPSFLFANGEVGVWFDPSDMSTMFQDSDGRTPVTAPGQPVGLILDKSKGLELGPELVTNGEFTSATLSGWSATQSPTYELSNGTLKVGVTTLSGGYRQDIITSAKLLKFSFRARRYSGTSGLAVRGYGQTGGFNNLLFNQAVEGSEFQEYEFYGAPVPGSSGVRIYIQAEEGDGVIEIDYFRVKEVLGHHASQTTTTARPILGRVPKSGRTNYLKWSEDLSKWTSVASTAVLVSDPVYGHVSKLSKDQDDSLAAFYAPGYTPGGVTAAINSPVTLNMILKPGEGYSSTLWFSNRIDGAPGSARVSFSLLSNTFTFTTGILDAGINDLGNGYSHVWFSHVNDETMDKGFVIRAVSSVNVTPDLCYVARCWVNPGTAPTPYQKVTSQYDITEEGVEDCWYLEFDGVDDFLRLENTLTMPECTMAFGTDVEKTSGGSVLVSGAVIGYLLAATSSGRIVWARNQGTSVSSGIDARGPQGTVWQIVSGDTPKTKITNSKGESSDIPITNTSDFRFKVIGVFSETGPSINFGGKIYNLISVDRSVSREVVETLLNDIKGGLPS